MKVLVRCVRTKKYFKKGTSWTEDKAKAHDFQTTRNVIGREELREAGEQMEIVFSFGDQKFDMVIPFERMKREPIGVSPRKRSKNSTAPNVKKGSRYDSNVWPLPGSLENRSAKLREKRKG